MTGGCHRSPRYQGFGGTATSTTGTLWLLTNISTEEGKETVSTELVLHTSLLGYLQERQAVEEVGEGKQGKVQGPS